VNGWGISFDACPYLFATEGVSSLPTSTDADWSTDWFCATDTLEWFDRTIKEGGTPIDGGAVTGSQSFFVHDATVSTGPAAGHSIMSWLATRFPSSIASTQLSATLSASAHTFTVVDGAQLDTLPRVVWIEREAILCTGRVGSTVTVSSVPEGRGYYGSRAVAHSIDSSHGAAVQPEVWAEFPWVTKRRVVLWRVRDGVATPEWRGYASRSPRLDSGGAKFEIQCEDVWKFSSGQILGLPNAVARLRAYSAYGLQIGLLITDVGGGGPTRYESQIWNDDPDETVIETLDELFRAAILRVQLQLVADSRAVSIDAYLEGGRPSLRATASNVGGLTIFVRLGDEYVSGAGGIVTTNTWRAEVQLDGAPGALTVIDSARRRNIAVTSAPDYPATWPSVTRTDGGVVTFLEQILRGEYDADNWLTIHPVSTDLGRAMVDGTGVIEQKLPFSTPPRRTSWRFAAAATLVRATAHIRSDHFAYALKHVIADSLGIVQSMLDPRDWNLDELADRIVRITELRGAAVEWFLDGTSRLDDLTSAACTMLGLSIAVRRSRLCVIAWQPPLPTDSVVATLSTTDLVPGVLPQWTTMPDGLINTATVENDQVRLGVRDGRSFGRYGQGRTVATSLDGSPLYRSLLSQPRELGNQIMSRMIAMWSEPVAVGTISVPLGVWESTIHAGDYVRVSEWLLPNGAGGRGWNDVVQVISRTRNTKQERMELTLLAYNRSNLAGYAPAARVQSISSATLTLVDPVYIAGSDYAGSDLPGYASVPLPGYSPAAANDGGASRWAPGDAVELRLWDSWTDTRYEAVVLSVNPATRQVVLTAPVPTSPTNWPTQATAGFVQLRSARRGATGFQASQKNFAAVGDDATNTIGGTSEPAKFWSP
jgi:hypothetical protein